MLNLSHFLQNENIEEVLPRIERDKQMEEQFIRDLKEKMELEDKERLSEIHVSDLVYCLKKAYFRRKGYEKVESRESLMTKSLGKGHHHLYEVLKDHLKEVEIKKFGVTGTIDMLGEYPVELKTSRKNVNELDVPENYIRQIAYYCILTEKTVGYLIHINIIKPKVKVYRLDYSNVIEKYKAEFFERLERLKKALEGSNPSVLENTNYRWECRNCPFRKICRGDIDG